MDAKRDANRIPTLLGVSSINLATPTTIAVNPITGAMLIDASSVTTTLDTRYLKLNCSNDPLTSDLEVSGTITSKKIGVAGINLDPNAATGDFTLSLSPANLTANRRVTFPNADATIAGLEIANVFTTTNTFNTTIDWAGGNVTYVPLTGNIQTYINAAVAGDTLVLASGEYVITSTITVNKQLNIVGQGNAGFYTTPSASAHGTIISSTTGAVIGFNITSSNVRIAHLSINLTGAASTGINTATNLTGLVFTNVDVIITCTGLAQGFTVYGSNAVLRNLTFYITSSNTAAWGFCLWNDSSTTINAIVDAYNVTGTVSGAGSNSYGFVCENINDANTLTMNLISCSVKAVAGAGTDIAIAAISTTTNNSTINCLLCTLEGADYDAYQSGTNVLAIGGSVLVNNLVFGTVTYRAAMAAGIGIFSSTVVSKQIAAGGIGLDHNSATGNFTLSLSPANLTANRRVTFPNADLTFSSGGTLALAGFTATVPATGTVTLGTGTATRAAQWTDANTLAAANFIMSGANVLTLSATAASTLALAVSSGKTLTLTTTDNFNLTIPATGTAALGTGTATRLAVWSDANTLAAGTVVQPAANVLTLTNAAASTLALAITSTKTLTLTSTGDFNLTVPATGTAALLGTANVFTEGNTIASGKFLTALTDGNTGGLRAGSGSDVLFYRGGADAWRTPDSMTIDIGLNVGTASGAVAGEVRSSAGLRPDSVTTHQYRARYLSVANNGTDQVGTAAASFGFLVILEAQQTGTFAMFVLRGGANATQEVYDPSNTFSIIAGTANSSNIYWSVANARYEIENKLGGNAQYYIFAMVSS